MKKLSFYYVKGVRLVFSEGVGFASWGVELARLVFCLEKCIYRVWFISDDRDFFIVNNLLVVGKKFFNFLL